MNMLRWNLNHLIELLRRRQMAAQVESAARIPGYVGFFNALATRMLGVGVPMGPNALLTVRGRSSGVPRTTPVAIIEIEGRRWVSSPYGDVHWVRNLRVAGRATLTFGRREEQVTATELSPASKLVFFRDVFGPYVRRLPLGTWMIGSLLGAKDMLGDPEDAAERHPVFELHAA
jgi:deazaflavin-dependent oxidoreductase (nitroreductase family)